MFVLFFSTLLVVSEVKMPSLDIVYYGYSVWYVLHTGLNSCDTDRFSKTIKAFGTKHRAIFIMFCTFCIAVHKISYIIFYYG